MVEADSSNFLAYRQRCYFVPLGLNQWTMIEHERKRLITESRYDLSVVMLDYDFIKREHHMIENAKTRLQQAGERIAQIKRNLLFLTLTSSEPTPKRS